MGLLKLVLLFHFFGCFNPIFAYCLLPISDPFLDFKDLPICFFAKSWPCVWQFSLDIFKRFDNVCGSTDRNIWFVFRRIPTTNFFGAQIL